MQCRTKTKLYKLKTKKINKNNFQTAMSVTNGVLGILNFLEKQKNTKTKYIYQTETHKKQSKAISTIITILF